MVWMVMVHHLFLSYLLCCNVGFSLCEVISCSAIFFVCVHTKIVEQDGVGGEAESHCLSAWTQHTGFLTVVAVSMETGDCDLFRLRSPEWTESYNWPLSRAQPYITGQCAHPLLLLLGSSVTSRVAQRAVILE
jgi:hypothetical protein